jgi:hypothetical protein
MKGSNLQFEVIVGRPIHMNRICRFDGYDAIPDQLDDNVLCADDCQGIAGDSCFFKGPMNCPRIVDCEGAASVEGDGDCRAPACAKSTFLSHAKEDIEFRGIVDAVLGDLADGKGDLIGGSAGRDKYRRFQQRRGRLR